MTTVVHTSIEGEISHAGYKQVVGGRPGAMRGLSAFLYFYLELLRPVRKFVFL